jgi:hypothetical protein
MIEGKQFFQDSRMDSLIDKVHNNSDITVYQVISQKSKNDISFL